MNNKTHHFIISLGLIAMLCFYGCWEKKQAKPKRQGMFAHYALVKREEVPRSLQKECADACIEAMKASRNQVNGGADDQDLEDVVEQIRYSMMAIYQRPTTYMVLTCSSGDKEYNALWINITDLTKSQIDSVLIAYSK